jgi:hypothetical protein
MAKLPSITVLASILILVSMVMIIYWYAFKRGTFFMAEVAVILPILTLQPWGKLIVSGLISFSTVFPLARI